MLARSRVSKLQRFLFMRLTFVTAVAVISIGSAGNLHAQFGGGGGVFLGNANVVGGVEINPDGVLNNSTIRLDDDLRSQLERGLKAADANLGKSGLRMISLKALEQQLVDCRNSGKPFPPDVLYMAGLQRIEYVVVSPYGDDVIIAGYGEGFKSDANGNVVGTESGMPVIQLQDFLVAMRCVDQARQDYGISVSIDPTEEGSENIRKVMQQLTFRNFNEAAAAALEQAGGPQQITLTGVPKDSRFSQVLVAADYRMKRLAMGLEESPEFLPNILAMAKAKDSATRKMTPRFWMECHYEPVAVSEDKSIWKLSGNGVRAKTEEEITGKDGTRKSEKPDKLAKKWADTMTKHYEELSKAQPVFRELRNMMDLSVVAAIIAKEKLLQRVDLDLPTIKGWDTISTPTWNVPQTIPTQCSFTRLSRSLMVTTSGGVTVDSWSVAANTRTDSKLTGFADKVLEGRSERWWWNAN